MYDVVLKDNKWWISKNGEIIKMFGSFDEPVSPRIIVEEINGELQV